MTGKASQEKMPDVYQASPVMNNHIFAAVTDVIHEIGVPPNLIGYRFLREAIIFSVNNTDAVYALTETLYPFVARKCNTTSARVVSGIRNAISVVYDRGNYAACQKYFGNTISKQRGKPTNAEFIAMITDYLALKQSAGEL